MEDEITINGITYVKKEAEETKEAEDPAEETTESEAETTE